MSNTAPRIAIVGAGIIGLSLARALGVLGAKVTVFERSHLGAGTSSRTFAWINSNGKKPLSYHALNCAAMQEHVGLQAASRTEARWLDVCGTFEWASRSDEQDRLQTRANSLQALGYPASPVSRAYLQARIPELRIDRHSGAIWHFPAEALVHPSILLAHLWSEARAHGATMHQHTDVLDVAETSDGVTLELSSTEPWHGDYCVLATGRWTPQLTARLNARLAMLDADRRDKRACGFLAVTAPQYVQLRANLITPDMNVRPDGGGRLLLQAPDLDDRADPAFPAARDGAVGQEMLTRLHRLFANTTSASIETLAVGQRSRPADGLPAVGFLTDRQRTYLVATHSGMTLGPLLGRLVGEELVQQRRSPLLQDFAPQRLLNRDAKEFSPIATIHYPAEQ